MSEHQRAASTVGRFDLANGEIVLVKIGAILADHRHDQTAGLDQSSAALEPHGRSEGGLRHGDIERAKGLARDQLVVAGANHLDVVEPQRAATLAKEGDLLGDGLDQREREVGSRDGDGDGGQTVARPDVDHAAAVGKNGQQRRGVVEVALDCLVAGVADEPNRRVPLAKKSDELAGALHGKRVAPARLVPNRRWA